MAPKVLVVIVTHQGEKWLEECLAPFANDRDGIDVLVVDNASEDLTCEKIKLNYPFVELYASAVNLGFGAANNIGIEKALANEAYQGVFLLNQDASVSAETIRCLAEYCLKNRGIGILSPLHYADREGALERGFAQYITKAKLNAKTEGAKLWHEIPFVNAALWYIPRATLASVGLFSPLFDHYGEDLDYVYRVRANGFIVAYAPSLKGYHFRDSGTIPLAKSVRLEAVYHLAQWISPLRSCVSQAIAGPISFCMKGLLSLLKGRTPLFKLYRNELRYLLSKRKLRALWINRPPYDPDAFRGYQENVRQKAPIAVFAYDRPAHLQRLLYDLQGQQEAAQTNLFVFCDGAKGAEDCSRVEQVKQIAYSLKGFATVTVIPQTENIGLARSIVLGVSHVLSIHPNVIVLEDDLRLSPYALRWANDALHKFQNNEHIAHLNLGTFFESPLLPSGFLSHFIGSWGWATWREKWFRYWTPNGKTLLETIREQPDVKARLKYGPCMDFMRMLARQVEGKNNSWAIRWHASLALCNQLSYTANPALAANEGFDGTGVHCSNDGRYSYPTAPYPVYSQLVSPYEELPLARKILTRYYGLRNNKVIKGYYRLKALLRKYLHLKWP